MTAAGTARRAAGDLLAAVVPVLLVACALGCLAAFAWLVAAGAGS